MIFKETELGFIWKNLVERLLDQGQAVSPRRNGTVELLDVQLRLHDPRSNVLVNPGRNVRYRFMVAEWLWIWFGHNDVATLARYNRRIADYSDDGQVLHGAYGPRIRAGQWDAARERLRRDTDSRQAVVQIFDARDLLLDGDDRPTKDVPCTLTLQFMVRQGRLRLTVNMRSSDVWLGLPYDVFSFTMLQNVMAAELGVELGEFTMNLASSHLYDRDREGAERALDSSNFTIRSPRLIEPPPEWLHEVLTGRAKLVVDLLKAGPWGFYATTLLSGNVDEALDVLRELESTL